MCVMKLYYKKIGNEGVISVDLIFSFIMIFMLLTGMWGIVSDRVDMASESEKLAQTRNLAENVASTINKVYSGGCGHEMTLDLPKTIKNANYYLLKVNNGGVYIKTDGMMGKAGICPVLIVDGEMKQKEIIMLPGKRYKIRNVPGNDGKTLILIESA